MTRKEFLAKLAKTKKQRTRSKYVLRYNPPDAPRFDSPYYCPITVVASAEFNKDYSLSGFRRAGLDLGLSPANINIIVKAADRHPKFLKPRTKQLREDMEAAE